ncbi:MAG: flagellar hook-length control protein FliK [Campylobacterales bacterium]|nr:flagellar hook-length control protein FliK [Campylobacterales bacterium]
MQNLMKLTTPKTEIPIKKGLQKASKDSALDVKDIKNSKSNKFLNLILQHLNAKKEVDVKPLEFTKNIEKSPTKELLKSDTPLLNSKESFNSSFNQLVQILEILNDKGDKKFKLPKLDGKLQEVLNKESVLKEFKSAKTLNDLIKLGKKYSLGLEKIQITKKEFEKLESRFTNLKESGFFKKETISSEELLLKKHENIEKQKVVQKNGSAANLLKDNSSKQSSSILEKIMKEVDLKKSEVSKNVKKDEVLNEPKNIKNAQNVELKNVKHEIKVETKAEPKMVQVADEGTKTNQRNVQIQKDNSLENLTKLSNSSSGEFEDSESKSEEKSGDLISNRQNIKSDNQPKNTQLRQTFSSFAQNLKEQVENYKPPMMKIQMALNPKNLGEVDVTLINRGNNLHINFTSSPQTLNLFIQNQAEFKNSLVNMGFTNLEMNFSQNGEKNRQEFANSENYEAYDEEEENLIEIVLPNYA